MMKEHATLPYMNASSARLDAGMFVLHRMKEIASGETEGMERTGKSDIHAESVNDERESTQCWLKSKIKDAF